MKYQSTHLSTRACTAYVNTRSSFRWSVRHASARNDVYAAAVGTAAKPHNGYALHAGTARRVRFGRNERRRILQYRLVRVKNGGFHVMMIRRRKRRYGRERNSKFNDFHRCDWTRRRGSAVITTRRLDTDALSVALFLFGDSPFRSNVKHVRVARVKTIGRGNRVYCFYTSPGTTSRGTNSSWLRILKYYPCFSKRYERCTAEDACGSLLFPRVNNECHRALTTIRSFSFGDQIWTLIQWCQKTRYGFKSKHTLQHVVEMYASTRKCRLVFPVSVWAERSVGMSCFQQRPMIWNDSIRCTRVSYFNTFCLLYSICEYYY